ncbi:MAG TPA: DUF488 family protein [Stellaceae bacterium]|nr:DUF488 family protein [Stellaceae bacterium]
MARQIRTKRAYDPPEPHDGTRVLADRLWPRGLAKDKAAIDLWLKDAAPSTELRRWFGHRPERWQEFRRRYRDELAANPEALAPLPRDGVVTLLFAAHDIERNNAVVLAEYLAAQNKAS